MTREEIDNIERRAAAGYEKGMYGMYAQYAPSPITIMALCKLAREALDKRDAEKKKQEIVNDTADTNSFHAGGTGF